MFSFRLFVLIGVLIVVFLGVNLGKEYYREYQIQKEIGSLKKEIESLERDIYKFSQLAEYYETDEYKVAEARKRFGLGKEGEKLAVFYVNDKKNFIEAKDIFLKAYKIKKEKPETAPLVYDIIT